MYELKILSGGAAVGEVSIERFPFVVGSGQEVDLRVVGLGIWDKHFSIELGVDGVPILRAFQGADVYLNDQLVSAAKLSPGDIIVAGDFRFQFGFSPVTQKDFSGVEILAWMLIGVVTLLQLTVLWLIQKKL